MIYAKRLNGAQRRLLIDLEALTGLEPLYQDDLDDGTITFSELWYANERLIFNIYCSVQNLTNGRSHLGLRWD